MGVGSVTVIVCSDADVDQSSMSTVNSYNCFAIDWPLLDHFAD